MQQTNSHNIGSEKILGSPDMTVLQTSMRTCSQAHAHTVVHNMCIHIRSVIDIAITNQD
jgi:hypothetical protein